uniref:WD repeat domain 75 n=1 Tax=Salmo trutta TaxID=8032 RepID=A0A673YH05_SALTR
MCCWVRGEGGSKINFREPVITNDSRFLLCASGESVKVYSSSSEECVHDLQGHTDLVSGIVRNPSNHLQVYSCSADGTVRLWDFTDGILIKTFIIGYPIYSIYVSENHGGVVFVVVPMANDKSSELFQLVAVHLPRSGDQEVEARELSAVLCDVSPSGAVSFGREGEYIAAAKGLQLEVFFFKKQKSYRFFLKSGNKKGAKNAFTCVSCHPKEDCIATGHEDGKIRLWRNFNQKKEYTYSTLHWHHGAVNTLQFTPEEITIIQSCVKVSAIIQGLVKGEGVRTDLMIDPRSKALVLNGKPGHLQFYSLPRDKLLYNLDIVQQEYIHEEGLDQFEVVKAAFDTRGDWLATVEERTQKGSELEINLKLWAYNEQTQSFVLNTTVTAPHEDQITAMCFSPSPETTMLVTISFDGHFKAWLLADHSDTEEGASWSCDFVGGYHLLKPGCCCFSADGSLLAVGFQEVVTVWSPSWELLTTLSQPPGAIRDLCFGRLSCSKYLLGTSTKNQLCCWNLLTCSLEWSTPVDVSLLQADPLSENMAAFCSQSGCSDLFVFKPGESRPLYSQRALCTGKVQHAVFAPRDQMLESCEEHAQWLNRSQLYFLTQHMDLMTFSTKTEEDRLLASSKRLMVDDSVAVTPFYLLLGKHRQQQQQEALTNPMAERIQLPQGSIAIKELLYTPAHVLPSASFLCSMFVRSLLISSSAAREEKEPVEEEMESEEEDSEGEAELRDARQDLGGSATWGPGEELGAPALTKAQERELRRVKHFDHSWLSSLLEC